MSKQYFLLLSQVVSTNLLFLAQEFKFPKFPKARIFCSMPNAINTQFDQIALLFAQYLTINSNGKLPNIIENLSKYVKNNAKY